MENLEKLKNKNPDTLHKSEFQELKIDSTIWKETTKPLFGQPVPLSGALQSALQRKLNPNSLDHLALNELLPGAQPLVFSLSREEVKAFRLEADKNFELRHFHFIKLGNKYFSPAIKLKAELEALLEKWKQYDIDLPRHVEYLRYIPSSCQIHGRYVCIDTCMQAHRAQKERETHTRRKRERDLEGEAERERCCAYLCIQTNSHVRAYTHTYTQMCRRLLRSISQADGTLKYLRNPSSLFSNLLEYLRNPSSLFSNLLE